MTHGTAVIEDFETTLYLGVNGWTTSLAAAEVLEFGYGRVNENRLPDTIDGIRAQGTREGTTWIDDDGEIVARVVFTTALR